MHTYVYYIYTKMFQTLLKKLISGAAVIFMTTSYYTGFSKRGNDDFEVVLETYLSKEYCTQLSKMNGV